jgi:RNA recognition motif-containing protein
MAKKLYVGNLSATTTNDQLQALFTPFGKVDSARVIMDHDTGVSKGFGFVEMPEDQEAEAATKGLSGKEHDGRTLKVNEAKSRRAEAPAVSGGTAPGVISSN